MTLPRPAPFDLVIDTSAMMAIATDEEAGPRAAAALRAARGPAIAAPTRLELAIVAEARLGDGGAQDAIAVLDAAEVVTFPFDQRLMESAFEAWRRFGKGRHRAALNLGDCFGYALAHHLGVPLLCVGNDFPRTDVAVVDLAAIAT